MENISPRERRAQKTHRAILDAARKIINQKGIAALSMRAIANAIDYSPAGLYEYFGSKEEIIGAVIEEGFQRFTHHLQQVDQSLPVEEYAIELGIAYIDFAVGYPDFFLLMFTTAPLIPNFELGEADCSPQERLSKQPSFNILLQAVQRGVDEGAFQPQAELGIFEMAYASWSLVHGIAMLRVAMLKEMALGYASVDRAVIQALHRGMRGQVTQ